MFDTYLAHDSYIDIHRAINYAQISSLLSSRLLCNRVNLQLFRKKLITEQVIASAVQPSKFTSTAVKHIAEVVQITDLPSTLHIEVVQPSDFTSTSNTSEHQRKHTRTGMWKTQLTQINHTSAPVDVVEEISHKSPSLLTGGQQLSQQIGLIFMSVDITSPPFVNVHALTDKVVCRLSINCFSHLSKQYYFGISLRAKWMKNLTFVLLPDLFQKLREID
jgi:hypothetical protein